MIDSLCIDRDPRHRRWYLEDSSSGRWLFSDASYDTVFRKACELAREFDAVVFTIDEIGGINRVPAWRLLHEDDLVTDSPQNLETPEPQIA
ncbi:MAG: hypothetical protein ACFB21_15915 [Opitutales bacterium]